MTKSGIKTEDYREINPNWCNRLLIDDESNTLSRKFWKEVFFEGGEIKDYHLEELQNKIHFFPVKFNTNTMTLGYPSKDDKDRIIQFEHAGIEIREGNPEWGAEQGKLYFVIKHGKRIL